MTNSQRATEMCGLKYTREWNNLRGILGREEELNNHGRRVTHEGNSAITGGDEIRGLDLHRQPNHKERLWLRSADRLENRIAREQVWEWSKLVSHSGIEQRRAELQYSAEVEIINVFSITPTKLKCKLVMKLVEGRWY